jgi:tetratricopeptide (TPR) repeat protein
LIELDPKSGVGYYERAKVLRSIEKNKEALADYGKAMEVAPDYPDPFLSHGVECEYLHQYAQAIKDYTRYLELDKGFDGVFMRRARDYELLGDYKHAIEDYGRLLKLNPKDDQAYQLRGDAWCKLKQYDNAIADYSKALTLDPTNPEVILERRAKAYERMGKQELAAADRKKLNDIMQHANRDL